MITPDYSKLNGGSVREISIKTKYPEFYQYIIDTYPADLSFREKLYWYFNNLTSRPVCKVCGKETTFVNIKEGYREYCSRVCLNQDPDKKERTKNTCVKRYGGVAPACSQEVIEKSKRTCLEKFGVENAMMNAQVVQKSQETNISKYGGLGNASKELYEKQRETIKRLYDADNFMQSEAFYEEVANRHPDVLSVDIINKRFECSCPSLDCNSCSSKTYFIPISQYHNRRNMTGTYKCTTTNPIKEVPTHTSIETFVHNILDRYNIEYETNNRSIISPQELDVYIPSQNIAIECNGIYYHNSIHKTNKYHLNKYKQCLDKDIQLLTIWEDWIYQKPEIVESMLLSKLGIYKERIYARKCIVREVSSAESNQFLDKYHIQGKCPSNTKLGLYYNDELVSLMTFAYHRNNIIGSNGYELVRFCNKIGTQVIGGAERLLTHYIRENQLSEIYSFSSNDISNGNLYSKLGFEKGLINQSYWYIESSTMRRYHRSSFTKDSIIKKGWKKSKDGWTEREVMLERGYYQIYDSGQTKWIKKYK